MPVSRYYKTAAVELLLGSSLPDSSGGAYAGQSVNVTTFQTTSGSTVVADFQLPTQFPFTLIIDPDETNEEVVEVTNIVGNTFTITRAVDSSNLVAHTATSKVRHGVSARDYAESRAHEAATTNVHGITGAIAPIASPTFTGTVTAPTVAVTTALNLTGNLSAGGATISPTELSYLDTVSSNVQTQLDAKSPIASPTFTGTVAGPIINATTKFQVNGVDVTGLTGAWTAFTPTLTNWGVGNGTWASYYTQIGKTVIWQMRFTLGTNTTKSGSPVFSLPVTAARSGSYIGGTQAMFRAGTTAYAGSVWVDTSTTAALVVNNSSTTYLSYSAISSSVPAAWTDGDHINFVLVYEAA